MAGLDLGMVAALAAIAFLGSFVYGVTGFGSGLITVTLASLFFEMRFVLAVFALMDCVNALRVSLARTREAVPGEIARLVPSCIAGVAIGALMVVALPPWILMLALGAFVSAFSIYSLAASGRLPAIGMRWAYVAGVSGGITSAMFGAGGPPYAVYLSMRPHGKEALVATMALTSLVSITTRTVAFGIAGLLSSTAVWGTALAILPASLAALWLADRVHRLLSREAMVRAIRILLGIAGFSLVVRAIGAA